jgi:two-component system chemotaxis response regulator CheB
MGKPSIVVVGASAGGVTALQRLVPALPADFAAPLLVVLHTGSHPSRMPQLLANKSRLEVKHAVDGEKPRAGAVYFAPPDHHMVLESGLIRLTRGPKEHHSRPAVDPLFRSAALDRGAEVIGVLLTGYLDDGTAGLQAIKARGGVAIVQDPLEAEQPSMPTSALGNVAVDHCLPLAEMPAKLVALLARTAQAAPPAPAELVHEHALANQSGDPMEHLPAIGHPSTFVCPDCQGSLWELDGTQPLRFRCHTGHGFSLRSLQKAQSDQTEAALWSAIRALQEKELLLRRIAELSADPQAAGQAQAEAEELATRVTLLRTMVEAP